MSQLTDEFFLYFSTIFVLNIILFEWNNKLKERKLLVPIFFAGTQIRQKKIE